MTTDIEKRLRKSDVFACIICSGATFALAFPSTAFAEEGSVPEESATLSLFLVVLFLWSLGLFIIGIHYLRTLFDQRYWDKVDLNHGRAVAREKMAKRLWGRKVAVAGVGLLSAFPAAVISIQLGGFFIGFLGVAGSTMLVALAVYLLVLRKTFSPMEEQTAPPPAPSQGTEQALPTAPSTTTAEQPWLVRTPSGKTFKTNDIDAISRAVKEGKLPSDSVVRLPGREDWQPLRDLLG